jgi:hypothetical protein
MARSRLPAIILNAGFWGWELPRRLGVVFQAGGEPGTGREWLDQEVNSLSKPFIQCRLSINALSRTQFGPPCIDHHGQPGADCGVEP